MAATMDLQPIMNAEEIADFLDREFPQVNQDGRVYHVQAIGPGSAVLRLEPTHRHLRPGGTLSGPALFTLADLAAYVVILAHIGPVALAVTTNLNINFLRRPAPGPLDARCTLLKLGARLAVVDIALVSLATDDLVAHATSTYSIPPRK